MRGRDTEEVAWPASNDCRPSGWLLNNYDPTFAEERRPLRKDFSVQRNTNRVTLLT